MRIVKELVHVTKFGTEARQTDVSCGKDCFYQVSMIVFCWPKFGKLKKQKIALNKLQFPIDWKDNQK